MFELYIAIISLLIAALSLLYTIEDKKFISLRPYLQMVVPPGLEPGTLGL